jgi:hypothetical protein
MGGNMKENISMINKEGQGTFWWPTGKIYVGYWKDGLQHGDGIYTNAKGIVKEGKWDSGKRIKIH